MRIVDLFSGCGGMSLGVHDAFAAIGITARSALALDIDPSAKAIYQHNIEVERFLRCDVRSTDLPGPNDLGPIDILIGGPPCQGHSNLNNRSRRTDKRNGLYVDMAHFAIRHDIPVVVIENVPSVVRSDHDVVAETDSRLKSDGYHTEQRVIDCAEIGIPQRRKRHILLATRENMPDFDHYIDAFRTPPRSTLWAIDDLVDTPPDHPRDVPSNLSPANRARIDALFDNDLYELPEQHRPRCHQYGHTYRSVYGRMRPDEPAGTITTGFSTPGRGRFIHPTRRRTLTIHEAARLQSFPDWFDFFPPGVGISRSAAQTAIGNAVPPALAFMIGLWAAAALGDRLHDEPTAEHRTGTDSQRPLAPLPA